MSVCMKRALLFVFSAVILTLAVCPRAKVSAAELDIDAKSCILMEMTTGTVLYEYNADEALPPASVTKIMTILIVMDAIDDGMISSDDIVTVSANAASMGGSQVYLEAGEEMSVGELLKCVIIASANDAAVALAEYVSGSESAFVERMNERATGLGMTNTHFVNTNGLDDSPDAENHLTSARDIAIMSCELMTKHPEVTEYTTVWMDTIRNGEFGLTNTNRLVRFYRGATGLKTGSTSKAGFCISATAERDGMQLVAVIMGSPTRDVRNEAAKTLLDYGYANYSLYTSNGGEGENIAVTGGKADTAATEYASFSCVLGKGKAASVTEEITINKSAAAPLSVGDVVGEVTYTLDGEVIGSVPVTVSESVERIGYIDIIYRMFLSLIGKYSPSA
ncbi:MAG: D-alanyl-D-alanine carboxypeptidase [Clostridia bacterium]|nr:D-alanyl-D-alanine carboxypeptidase [Clostridia bacterium]